MAQNLYEILLPRKFARNGCCEIDIKKTQDDLNSGKEVQILVHWYNGSTSVLRLKKDSGSVNSIKVKLIQGGKKFRVAELRELEIYI